MTSEDIHMLCENYGFDSDQVAAELNSFPELYFQMEKNVDISDLLPHKSQTKNERPEKKKKKTYDDDEIVNESGETNHEACLAAANFENK